MSDSSDDSGYGCFVVVAMVLLLLLSLFSECPTPSSTRIGISRDTQRCEVQGRPKGCVKNTAWAVFSDQCSCALSDSSRITFKLLETE